MNEIKATCQSSLSVSCHISVTEYSLQLTLWYFPANSCTPMIAKISQKIRHTKSTLKILGIACTKAFTTTCKHYTYSVLPPKYLTNPANKHYVLSFVSLCFHVMLFNSVLLKPSTVWHILCEPSVMHCCYMEYISSFLLLNITVFLEFVVNVTTKHMTSQCWNCIKTTIHLRL